MPNHSDALPFCLTKTEEHCQQLLRTISEPLHLSVDLLPFLPFHPSISLPSIYRLIALMIYIVTLHPLKKREKKPEDTQLRGF